MRTLFEPANPPSIIRIPRPLLLPTEILPSPIHLSYRSHIPLQYPPIPRRANYRISPRYMVGVTPDTFLEP